MKLLLVRHGHPDYVRDVLTPLGHAQAKLAAERIREEKIDFFFSSPFGRARQTASYAAEAFGAEVTVLPFMRELSWGPTGERVPELHYNPWMQADMVVREGARLDETAPYLRENTVFEHAARVVDGADEWLVSLGYVREGLYYRCTRKNDSVCAVYGHAGSFAALLSHLLNVPFATAVGLFQIGFTGISCLSLKGETGELIAPRLTLLNDERHTRGAEASGVPQN